MAQITGHAEFCELFLDDVFVPKENLLGERGDGWAIAMHALARARHGRAPAPGDAPDLVRPAVADAARASWTGTAARSARRRPLLPARSSGSKCSVTTRTGRSSFLNGGAVGPESSSVKLLMAQAEQTLGATALEVLGDARATGRGDPERFWHEPYLYSRAASVYGGTQQIQRNIIADRVLALPKD